MALRQWRLLASPVKGGHEFFETPEHADRIYVADQSGTFPDLTDDGPMYLDKSRAVDFEPETKRYYVPVIIERKDLEEDPVSRFVACEEEYTWIKNHFTFKKKVEKEAEIWDPTQGIMIESDLVGSRCFVRAPQAEKYSPDDRGRIRSVYFKPHMRIGQLLDYRGPYLIVQAEHSGKLFEVLAKHVGIIE